MEADAASVSLYFLLSVSLSFLGNILGMRGDDESCRLVCRISARGERRLERAWQTQVGSELPAELPDTSPPVTRPAPTCDGEADLRNMCDRVVKVEPLQM